jgi:hypothetical protein
MRYLLLLALFGCGSTETTNDGGADATSDQATKKDAPFGFDTGSDADGGPTIDAGPPVCPQAPPIGGTACTGVGLCEWGTSHWPQCDVLWRCDGSVWVLDDHSSECPSQADAGCVATDAGLSGVCPSVGWCETPSEECFCTTGCGGPPPMPTGSLAWWCAAPAEPNCPSPRPRFGDACTSEGQNCSYELCCGGAAMTCTGGRWTGDVAMFGCP